MKKRTKNYAWALACAKTAIKEANRLKRIREYKSTVHV